MKGQIIGRRLLNCFSKHFLLVAGTTVSTVFAVWLMSVFIYETEYMATSQVFVEPLTAETMRGEPVLASDNQTLEAYQILAKSPAVLAHVLEQTETAFSIAELHDRITIERPDNSRVLNIIVSGENENEAAGIANAIAFGLQEEVKNLLKVDNVSIILKAGMSDTPLAENKSLSLLLMLAAAAGLAGGVALSVLVELTVRFGRHVNIGRKKNPHLQTVFK